jgi:hypothetical protein
MGNQNDRLLNGGYFSDNGETIYANNGAPLFHLDHATGTFHRYSDGAVAFYFDMFGEHLCKGNGDRP